MAKLTTPTRRGLVLSTLAFSAVAGSARASDVVDLSWEDLIPEGADPVPKMLQGIVQHDQGSLASQQPASTGVRTDWNGQTVRLAGFIIPIGYDGTGVTEFILVPYVGACIHVPPPPANQLILVTAETPYERSGLFEPVIVTGRFGTTGLTTDLADIGYTISAEKVVPYG